MSTHEKFIPQERTEIKRRFAALRRGYMVNMVFCVLSVLFFASAKHRALTDPSFILGGGFYAMVLVFVLLYWRCPACRGRFRQYHLNAKHCPWCQVELR